MPVQRRKRENRRFEQVFGRKPSVSRKFLEVAVGQALENEFRTLPVDESWRITSRRDGPDRRDRHARGLPRRNEGLALCFGDRAQDLVVVAPGQKRLDADGTARYQSCGRSGQW